MGAEVRVQSCGDDQRRLNTENSNYSQGRPRAEVGGKVNYFSEGHPGHDNGVSSIMHLPTAASSGRPSSLESDILYLEVQQPLPLRTSQVPLSYASILQLAQGCRELKALNLNPRSAISSTSKEGNPHVKQASC